MIILQTVAIESGVMLCLKKLSFPMRVYLVTPIPIWLAMPECVIFWTEDKARRKIKLHLVNMSPYILLSV